MEASLPDAPSDAPSHVRAARVDDLLISVHSDPSAIEQIWRGLERRAPISIYQRYDWVLPWCRHAAPSLGIEPAVVLASRGGRPVMLLPFGRRAKRAWTEIGWLGDSHVNIGMGLFEPDFAATLNRDLSRELMELVLEALAPVDLAVLRNQPEHWAGRANPLRHVRGETADQPVLAIGLQRDFGAMMNARKRKKMRWQENRLAPVGGYRFFKAATREEALGLFDVFLAQKDEQFRRNGIRNVFADPGTATGFRNMIIHSIGQADPIIEIYGVEIDGEVRATFACGIHGGRAHGYFSGITADDMQRFSPGELLLLNLVRTFCERDLDCLDLGVGEERYKASWSPVREPQFATIAGATLRGRVIARGMRTAHALRLRVRSNDRSWQAAKRLRQWKARLLPTDR